MTPVVVPVVFKLGEHVANAGLVHFDLVGTCADPGGRVVKAAIRLDHKVVVGQQVRQVSIGSAERDLEVVAVRLHRLDALHDAESTRGRIFVGVTFHCAQNIFGGHRFPVVKLNTLTDLVGPNLAVVAGFHTFGRAEIKAAIFGHVGQAFAERPQVHERYGRCRQGRVQ